GNLGARDRVCRFFFLVAACCCLPGNGGCCRFRQWGLLRSDLGRKHSPRFSRPPGRCRGDDLLEWAAARPCEGGLGGVDFLKHHFHRFRRRHLLRWRAPLHPLSSCLLELPCRPPCRRSNNCCRDSLTELFPLRLVVADLLLSLFRDQQTYCLL